MSNLTIFSFEGQQVRFVDGKPLANDVAMVLGYADPAKTVSTKVFPENRSVTKTVTVDGKSRDVTVLEEAGVYQLIFSSKLESAAKFQQWVFNEVLPSIRKTGSYSISQNALDRPSRALVASREIKEIYDNVDLISPRLAQFLTDCCLNEVVNKSLPSGERLRGVVEIAQEMKLPVNDKNRSALGKFVKHGLSHLAKSEERLCNGTLQPIALYPDTPEVRERISLYFNS